MVPYLVYLEIAADGRCLAHVPEWPGCVQSGTSRDQVLRELPQAIRDHQAWLAGHGEPALPLAEPVTFEIAGESTGGPFDPGDAAALLPSDQAPVPAEEIEHHLRLMAHSRADLWALVRHLPENLLDWQPDPESFTLRCLLRHVGNAEEWYVSRLFPPETLPAEWENDAEMPLWEFLEMERRTCVTVLRQIEADESSRVHYPTRWTEYPEEAWTARKVLRRFLEHERQHAAQARRILDTYRNCLLARLAAERAGLLRQLLSLDEATLTERVVHGDWTVKDILAHIAAWDRWEVRAMQSMVASESPDLSAVEDFDAANTTWVAAWRDRTWAEVLLELQTARSDCVAWLRQLPVELFFEPRFYDDWEWTFSVVPLRVQWEHDSVHAQRIAVWCESQGLQHTTGTKGILLAALDAAREELLAAGHLVPADKRSSQCVCGIWTLQDVIGHLADWELLGAEGLRHMAAGQPPQVEHVTDIHVWNAAHVAARRGQSWETTWADLHTTRQAFREILEQMDQAQLAQLFAFPWGPQGTPYRWASVYVDHDRSHARGPRAASGPPLEPEPAS